MTEQRAPYRLWPTMAAYIALRYPWMDARCWYEATAELGKN